MESRPELSLCDLRPEHAELRSALETAFRRVLDRGDFILGREVGGFEEAFAAYCGASHGVAVANGTDALALTLQALGVGPGDEVVVPAFTFVATGTAVFQAGAKPVLADVDPVSLCLSPAAFQAARTPRSKAAIPVHLFGHPADWDGLAKAAAGLPLLEDACQAHGARWKGRRAGSLGVAAAFSFYPTKNLGALGDGGAVTTSDAALASRVRQLRNCGRTTQYDHPVRGLNSRLDTLQAALLLEKLPHLDAWNARRRAAAERYRQALAGIEELRLPQALPGTEPVWHQFVVRVRRRDELAAALKAQGIATGVHYPKPLHLQGAFAELGHGPGDFPVSEAASAEALSLPMFPSLREQDVARVAEAIRSFYTVRQTAGRA